MKKGKVHLSGIPCGSDKIWGSCFITSTSGKDKVTCKKCLKKLYGKDIS